MKACWTVICWSSRNPMRSASGSSTRRASASASPVNGSVGWGRGAHRPRVQDDRLRRRWDLRSEHMFERSRYHACIPDPRAVEHRHHDVLPPDAGRPTMIAAPMGWSSGRTMAAPRREWKRRVAARKEPHVTSRPPTTAMLGRRAHAQRRLRRAAGRRLFCSTNGCTTYLVLDADGRRATCPICGLRRSLPPGFVIRGAAAGHAVPVASAA